MFNRYFWVEKINTTIVILNKAHFKSNSDKNPYELWYGILVIVKHFKVFGSNFYIKRNDENLGNLDVRDDEGIFPRYSHSREGYKCYNKNIKKIFHCIDVKLDGYVESEVNQLVNTNSPNLVKNYVKVEDPLSNEENEYPSNLQA